MSPEKRRLLTELQNLETQWSNNLLIHGGCTVEMLGIESKIKSTRNTIKYQDVQENMLKNNPSVSTAP